MPQFRDDEKVFGIIEITSGLKRNMSAWLKYLPISVFKTKHAGPQEAAF